MKSFLQLYLGQYGRKELLPRCNSSVKQVYLDIENSWAAYCIAMYIYRGDTHTFGQDQLINQTGTVGPHYCPSWSLSAKYVSMSTRVPIPSTPTYA